MSLIIPQMITESKDLNMNPIPGMDSNDDKTDHYLESNTRQKVFNNWRLGDQIPLAKMGQCRPNKPLNGRKRSPKKTKNEAKQRLNGVDLENHNKRVDDIIEEVVKSSDSEANDSWTDISLKTETSVNSTFNSDINPFDDKLPETKAEVLNGINGNDLKSDTNSEMIEEIQRLAKKRPKLEKDDNLLKRLKTQSSILYEKLSLPSVPNILSEPIKNYMNLSSDESKVNSPVINQDMNITHNNDMNGQQMAVIGEHNKGLSETTQNDTKTKPKRERKPKLKIKTTTLFKSSLPPKPSSYLNSFQQFLSQPSVHLSADTSVNSVQKLKKFSKPKSETQIMAKKKVNLLKKKANKGIKGLNVKIKRSQKKPLIVKNLIESKSFLDFVNKKFPPIKEGVPFIQDRSCKVLCKEFESSNLDQCMDCHEKKGNSQTCRFFQYRTLLKSGDKLTVFAFAEERHATHDDCKLWLPATVAQPSNLNKITAHYLMIFVGREFCRIYERELQIMGPLASVTWKKPVKGIRELCDVCETTIFNTHYVCPKCGLAVCIDCYNRRASLTAKHMAYNTRRNHDQFGWTLCTDKKFHDFNAFHLAIFITRAVFGILDKIYHSIRNNNNIIGQCDCDKLRPDLKKDVRKDIHNFDIRTYMPNVPRHLICEDKLLILTDPKCADNLKFFQIFWLKGFPVLIEKVNESLDEKLWSPQNFNSFFGNEMSRLVNCMDGQILSKRPMSYFWNGFEDIDQRLVDEGTDEKMILKLKDWPPNAEFRDKLPIWFDNLMDALPLSEYTRYNGCRNLASRLPEFFVRPDLGPKMYCAYGSVLHPEKGTTNLHLDMSDAVNVMIYVGVAQQNNKPLQSHLDGANKLLEMGGCDFNMMNRANCSGHKVGALWHIWKAEDADKIRLFLNKVANERGMRIEANNDPIHDQSWYLDQNLRTRMEIEYNVKGVAIAQCLGDAILVPAGAPHQVQNIHSCIKVAGEFVSPENVFHCLAMTQQFRNLSKRHNNHEDKLQIKNIIYHTIKDCISEFLPPPPLNCLPIPPPPKLLSRRQPRKTNNKPAEKLPTLQPKNSIKDEKCNSIDTTLENISSNNQRNSPINQTSNSVKLENCSETTLSMNTCASNHICVDDNNSNSNKSVPNVGAQTQTQTTEQEVNKIKSEQSSQIRSVSPIETVSPIISEPPIKSESPIGKVSPSSTQIKPIESANNASENILDSPPLLTPYGCGEPFGATVQTKDSPKDSTEVINDSKI